MKRVLAILAACTLGFTGLAQFSGSWTTTLGILPAPVTLKSSVLTLNYEVAGWTLTSKSGFTSAGFADQDFSFAGTLGALSISGGMAFDPTVPKYESAWVEAALDFAGVSFDLTISHEIIEIPPASHELPLPEIIEIPPAPHEIPPANSHALAIPEIPPFKMEYELGVAADPVFAELTFVDKGTGIAFEALAVFVVDLPFVCCGLTYDVALSFTRAGFDYIAFYLIPLVEIWDISLGVDVEFTTTGKAVTPILAWPGITGCVTVWGDVVGLDEDEVGIGGLEIYGYRIHCELGEGNYLEIVTSFDPATVNLFIVDDFKGDEYQYIKLGFADPAAWELETIAFFQETGPLFGISRLGIDASVPVIPDTLAFHIAFTSVPTLDIGWTFTF